MSGDRSMGVSESVVREVPIYRFVLNEENTVCKNTVYKIFINTEIIQK